MFYVNEIFTSIQGEGYLTGVPAHFIRFQGCPVKCSFCDSKESIGKSVEPALSNDQLAQEVLALYEKNPAIDTLVFTGGEPLYDNTLKHLHSFLTHFESHFSSVVTWDYCMESSGYVVGEEQVKKACEVISSFGIALTISPKFDAHGEMLPIDPRIVEVADQVKFLVSHKPDSETKILAFIEKHGLWQREGVTICVQPIDLPFLQDATKMAQEQAISLAKKYNWRLSQQTHKHLGIR